MTKALRIILAVVVFIGVLLVARSQMAWAGNAPDQKANTPKQETSSAAAAAKNPGTVKPPPVVVPPITGPGTYSVGGVCTLIVERLVDTVSIHAVLLPFSTLHNKPAEIDRYIAGVCNVTFIQRPGGVIKTEVTPEEASVKVCFAGIPNMGTKIYFYDDHAWIALDTTANGGLVCAPATRTGKYVLTKTP